MDSGGGKSRRGRRCPDSKIVRVKRKANVGREDRREVIDKDVEEDRAEDRSLWYSAAYPEGTTRGVPYGDVSSAVGEKRLGPANKAWGQARGQKLVEESWVPDRVKSTGEINGG